MRNVVLQLLVAACFVIVWVLFVSHFQYIQTKLGYGCGPGYKPIYHGEHHDQTCEAIQNQ
jgi:hypothetical protein